MKRIEYEGTDGSPRSSPFPATRGLPQNPICRRLSHHHRAGRGDLHLRPAENCGQRAGAAPAGFLPRFTLRWIAFAARDSGAISKGVSPGPAGGDTGKDCETARLGVLPGIGDLSPRLSTNGRSVPPISRPLPDARRNRLRGGSRRVGYPAGIVFRGPGRSEFTRDVLSFHAPVVAHCPAH